MRLLLRRLLERAVDAVEEGELSLSKPRELLEAARLLKELETTAEDGTAEGGVAEELLDRLEELTAAEDEHRRDGE
ncbi:MAG: hypothetical protein GF399_11975 [Candidatus Coatesbacteria bacterium]|nr:hypothetical protein [Candidatus Coatesbacteria bacterium]